MWDGLRLVLRLSVRERSIQQRGVASGLGWIALIRKRWARNTTATGLPWFQWQCTSDGKALNTQAAESGSAKGRRDCRNCSKRN